MSKSGDYQTPKKYLTQNSLYFYYYTNSLNTTYKNRKN